MRLLSNSPRSKVIRNNRLLRPITHNNKIRSKTIIRVNNTHNKIIILSSSTHKTIIHNNNDILNSSTPTKGIILNKDMGTLSNRVITLELTKSLRPPVQITAHHLLNSLGWCNLPI